MAQDYDEKIKTFRDWLKESEKVVFCGGAGVSTASGMPDFRSPEGLYSAGREKGKPWARYQPERLLSHSFFVDHTDWFFDYYRTSILHPEAEPNVCHQALADWEEQGRMLGVITQNIDGLHQAAGSRKVCELHGTVLQNHCQKCHKPYKVDAVLECEGIPYCECGGVIKPDVTLYEESLPAGSIEQAVAWLSQADLLIVAGTSLAVYPAAGLIRYFGGDRTVLVNLGSTPLDRLADLFIREDLAKVFADVRDVYAEEADA